MAQFFGTREAQRARDGLQVPTRHTALALCCACNTSSVLLSADARDEDHVRLLLRHLGRGRDQKLLGAVSDLCVFARGNAELARQSPVVRSRWVPAVREFSACMQGDYFL